MKQVDIELGCCGYCGAIAPRHTFRVVEDGVLACENGRCGEGQ